MIKLVYDQKGVMAASVLFICSSPLTFACFKLLYKVLGQLLSTFVPPLDKAQPEPSRWPAEQINSDFMHGMQ